MMEDYFFHSSSSLRFLDGQTKSPKRKASQRKRSHPLPTKETDMLIDTIPPFVPDQFTEMGSDTIMNTDELNALLNNVLENKEGDLILEPMIDNNAILPPPSSLCGSYSNTCSGKTQGQSVVITITPLSSESKATVSRIVTCYCGDSCICPGCFVHPNNYDALLNQVAMSSSSCSSDDEYNTL
jgi:hypothetical protein